MTKAIVLTPESESIKHLCKKDKRLAKTISMVGPISYRITETPYSFLVTTIVGQMLSNKVAVVINNRLKALCGGAIHADVMNRMTDEEIHSIGISAAKVRYIRTLTDEIEQGTIDFAAIALMSDKDALNQLTSIHGIGKWTAKMYLIFILDRQDILPLEDVAFQQGYGWLYKTNDFTPAVITARCKKWKPYSSIAARYMYRALDDGFTKEEFHLFK